MPNPAEEQDLIALNAPLLAAIPESEDRDVFDPEQTISKLYLCQSQCAATLSMQSDIISQGMVVPCTYIGIAMVFVFIKKFNFTFNFTALNM